ncbi:MAG: sulfite exporter TauE/SafE family protein [Clostridia bacterium]|nr:sulfite exporter TauE/SafE family protein [Clostridia bacterium]
MQGYIILLISSFIAALISGAAGFGGALLLLPVLTLYLGVEMAVPVLTIAQLVGNISRMSIAIKQIEWKKAGLFLITALPLTAIGAFSFVSFPKDIVTRAVGGVLIALVLLKYYNIFAFQASNKLILFGGAAVGLLSGLAGSAGPLGAAVFLSLGLPPVAYIASEATTATAMHILKIIIYGKLIAIPLYAWIAGGIMGAAMIAGTYTAKRLISNMSKDRFQKYVAILLCIVGLYMLVFGAK